MAEPELKLDIACPRCGTSNMPAARKCRQCFADLEPLGAMPGLFDFPRAITPCPACGKGNAFNLDECPDCGTPMTPGKLPTLEQVIAPERMRKAVRGGRRKLQAAASTTPAWINAAWLLRLGSVLFLFWGIIDTSFWLDKFTRNMAPDDPLIIRYSLFAIYELVRDAVIVGAVWLLTFLKPRR